MDWKEQSLRYHSVGRPGKIEVTATKPCATQRDLSLAYTPGVAEACRAIVRNPEDVFRYTARGNLVAVVTNGTAVLGLGNIGPEAGKPVMEGKGVLFKRFADIDVFDIELDVATPDELVAVVKALAPTFGGINLEDIKAPECFEIEERLQQALSIPVFHDDQHGTAIIAAAGLLNALELTGRKLSEARLVFSGAGAAGIASANLICALGASPEQIVFCDTKGVIYKGRTENMNPYKERYATDTKLRTLEEAVRGADVFIGVSGKDVLSPKMLQGMAKSPIVFAMANPDPEITFEAARAARDDVIMASGRSDYPNQVNNVLGFPAIFRGALDVQARKINVEMKIAAAHALATLAREPMPDSVLRAYHLDHLEFGPDYIIPKPFDPRVLTRVASAVAKAAIESGVAKPIIKDWEEYKARVEGRLSRSQQFMHAVYQSARKTPKRIVYPDGEDLRVLKACTEIVEEGIAEPILLGRPEVVRAKAKESGIQLGDKVVVVDPAAAGEEREQYARHLFKVRQRKGLTLSAARLEVLKPAVFGALMVETGHADGLVTGAGCNYPDSLRPLLQVVGLKKGVRRVAGYYIILLKNDVFFFSDTAVNINPDAETLAEIALLTAEACASFNMEPKTAFLSFSNFGSVRCPETEKVRRAAALLRQAAPHLVADGEMQSETALVPEFQEENYPFCRLKGKANVLIFPDLNSANIAYKLMLHAGGAEVIGPVTVGFHKPVNVLNHSSDAADIVRLTAVTVLEAHKAAQ